MEACHAFYDPTEANAQFIIHFDQDEKQEQRQRAAKVIAHLETLDAEALAQESVQFFKWVVLHHLGGCNRFYAQDLLEFFRQSLKGNTHIFPIMSGHSTKKLVVVNNHPPSTAFPWCNSTLVK